MKTVFEVVCYDMRDCGGPMRNPGSSRRVRSCLYADRSIAVRAAAQFLQEHNYADETVRRCKKTLLTADSVDTYGLHSIKIIARDVYSKLLKRKGN